MDINNVNEMLVDVLKEIGNIGAGNAATALAKMIDKKVDMLVPQVKIIDIEEVQDILGGAEMPVAGIYFQMTGEVEGNMMFLLDIESANNLIPMIFQREKETDELDAMDISVLSEVGNILAASYMNSLSKLTNLTLNISVPSVSIDMVGAILSVPAIQFGQFSDKLLFIETEFVEDEKEVTGDFFLLPDIESFDKILRALGVV
ncbi:MAG: chemotaxis protein CheC [Tissierellales bacterium]|jgi:chemotaxis protein CheC|nr:chemotaxis protein CheC [Tissierellales bacterium]